MATKNDAAEAIYDNIVRIAGNLDHASGAGTAGDAINQASTLKNLALAYRFVSGGQQPGGGAVPSK